MEMNGEFVVDAGAESVHRMMTDIRKLTEIIPDVIEKEIIDEKNAKLTVKAGISTIKGKFNLVLSINGDNSRSIEITAKGKGSAGTLDVRGIYSIESAGDNKSTVKWKVNFNIGGTVATMGSHVINSVAQKYVETMTENFRRMIAGGS